MTIYYSVVFFILGMVLGSFYNVAGERLPNKESLIKPRSHCPKCGHKLNYLELIPLFSYIVLRGRCRYCKEKISILHFIFELVSGMLFMISFLIFGLSLNLLFALTFISILLITVISDYKYMIICDEVLIVGNIILILELFLIKGSFGTMVSIFQGVCAFLAMLLIKLLGDFLFKKESMGGGDIKLMFTFGLALGFVNAIFSIFIASIIGLPISLILYVRNHNHEVPFGPYLALAAIIILLTGFNYLGFLELI